MSILPPAGAPSFKVDYTELASAGTGAEKPGWATTEFWTLVAHYGITLFMTIMAFLHPGYHLPPNAQGLVAAIVPGIAAISAAIAHQGYARSRATSKAAQANLRAEQLNAETHLTVQREAAASSERVTALQVQAQTEQYQPKHSGAEKA